MPAGWDDFHGLVDAQVSAYQYYRYVLDSNGVLIPYGELESDYQTDVITGLATTFIENQEADDDRPFFLSAGYVAPHWSVPPCTVLSPDLDREGNGQFESTMVAPPPARRHMDELAAMTDADVSLPRGPAYNEEDVSDKPAFVRNTAPLTQAQGERLDRWYRARLASLLAVDEGLRAIREALDAAGELGRTIFVFTSDNGWMQGEHRLAYTKLHVYQESTVVPLVIAGPGIRAGGQVAEATSNIDIAATILDLAGAQPRSGYELDGMSLVPYLVEPDVPRDRVVFHETSADQAGYLAARLGPWKLRRVRHRGDRAVRPGRGPRRADQSPCRSRPQPGRPGPSGIPGAIQGLPRTAGRGLLCRLRPGGARADMTRCPNAPESRQFS